MDSCGHQHPNEYLYCPETGEKIIKNDIAILNKYFKNRYIGKYFGSYIQYSNEIFDNFPKINDKYVICVEFDKNDINLHIKQFNIYQLDEYAERFNIEIKIFSKWYKNFSHKCLTNKQVYIILPDQYSYPPTKFIDCLDRSNEYGEVKLSDLIQYMERNFSMKIINDLRQ